MVISILLILAASKYTEVTINLDENTDWKYLSKFATDIGKGNWEARAKIMKPLNNTDEKGLILEMSVYLDDRWEEVLETTSCKDKLKVAKREKFLLLPRNGDWSNEITGTLSEKNRPHFWFFSLSDCERLIKEKHRIRVELNFINVDGSQFSYEDQGLISCYTLVMFFFLFAFTKNFKEFLENLKKTENYESNVLIMVIALGCEFIGILCELLHLIIYYYNGSGFVVLDFFYDVLELGASLLIEFLFIIMASGWTLTYRDFPEIDVYLPIGLLVLMLNFLTIGLGRIVDDAYYKFSNFEGIPAYVLLICRIGLWIWFLFLANKLVSNSRLKASGLILNFCVLASLYFLSWPFLLVLSWTFSPYWRNIVVVIGELFAQILVFSGMMHLFSKKSGYYKISTMSQSVLPGRGN